jgi:RNA polymerase sigma factor (sigma-70 family)
MSCVRKFFEDNYDELLVVATRYVKGYGGDLLNDLALFYLEEPKPKLEEMCKDGELMSYICRTMAICGFSKTTRYPLALLQTKEEVVENENEKKETLDYINSILQEMDWFSSEVFRIYYLHNHSLKTLSNATGISKSTLYNALRKAQEEVKEKVKGFRGHHRKNN